MEYKKRTLLERHGIPIHHLDFKYIKDCNDSREMEKIVHILRSNEEGYFPDLTLCAEEKLKELKPHSRLFRVEEQIKGREALQPDELKPIYDWNQSIKATDRKLQKLVVQENGSINGVQMPPIRKTGSILQSQSEKYKQPNTEATKTENQSCQRIKSTDYNKWDKYDADEEILRLDLAEERKQEEVERKNRLNMETFIKKPLTITEIKDDDLTKPLDKRLLNLSDIEKHKLSEEYRIRGNEYFRSKEYDLALNEYTCAIECCPETAVAAYNNRALTYFKERQFLDSIKDCEQALKLEPNNLKAQLRLAEATYASGRRRESYQLYLTVLQLDAHNSVAMKAIMDLRQQFADLPPPHATRLKIVEESSRSQQNKNQAHATEPPKSTLKTKTIDYDLAELVKPNRVIQNKIFNAAKNLGKKVNNTTEKVQDIPQENNNIGLRLSVQNQTKQGKKLIEEL